MRQIILAILSLFLIPNEVAARPSQKIINQCMKATDFQGCVNVMTDKSGTESEKKITVDIDMIRTTGNSCPKGWGYIGGGYCRDVICASDYYNHSDLGGKGWGCSANVLGGRGGLQWDGEAVRSTVDKGCPMEEPEVGRNNSCENGLTEAEINDGKRNDYHQIGLDLYNASDYKGSIEAYTKYIEVSPKSSYAFYNRALSKAQIGDNIGYCNDMKMAAKLGDEDAPELIKKYC